MLTENIHNSVFSKFKQEGKEIKAELKNLQYNDALSAELPKTELKYEWSIDKKTGEINELEQEIDTEYRFSAKAKYNRQKNETEVKIKKSIGKNEEETIAGQSKRVCIAETISQRDFVNGVATKDVSKITLTVRKTSTGSILVKKTAGHNSQTIDY